MTEAEQMLVAAADLNRKAEAAERNKRPVELPALVVRELAYFLEHHGQIAARAGGLRKTGTAEAAAEFAHDIARTHLGGSK
ncbi:hypothetical protein ACFQ67_00320 [Streptomyces sp. NPDC056488]|uniref:hypothetical protein n=1 Tax=Streptomyces sp. NPDC056488 TaxID=3345836 RepID=UPI0036B0AD26